MLNVETDIVVVLPKRKSNRDKISRLNLRRNVCLNKPSDGSDFPKYRTVEDRIIDGLTEYRDYLKSESTK